MRFIMSYYYDMYINQNTPYIEMDLPLYMTLIPFLCPKEITYDLVNNKRPMCHNTHRHHPIEFDHVYFKGQLYKV